MSPDGSVARRKDLLPFAALSASYFAHIGFFNPYLPLWLKELGFGLFAIAVLTSVQSATRLFAPYAWGWLSDRTGERVRLLRYGATAALLLSLGLWLELGPVGVFVVLLLMFSHTSGMMPMSEAALAHLVSRRDGGFDARRYGRVRVWGSLGFLVTVLAAGAWFESAGMGSFPLWTLLTLLAVAASVWWLPDLRDAAAHAQPHAPVWPVLRQPRVRWFFASAFFHVLAHMVVYIFFSLYLDALGFGKHVIGLLWAVSVVLEILWFFTQGRWLPRLSLGGWLVLAAGLMVLRMGLTAAWPTLAVLLLAQTVHAITFAAHHSVCIALVTQHFPARLRGRGQALYSVIAYGVAGVVAGFGGGWVSAQLGLQAVFWLATVAALLAVACALRAARLARAGGAAD